MTPRLLVSSLAIASAAFITGPVLAETYKTDHDYYPLNTPGTYNQSVIKVLDLSSDTNLPAPYIQFEFRDQVFQRQFNAFRAINREMWDLQTMSDYNIRTRDLPSSYCSTLLSEGYNVCAPVVVEQPAPPPAPLVEPPAPPAPVPALW
ncbi:MAG: hypothetical protein HC919_13430 [Oscillatoriales cyanobacterium SM2_2_1]|nr:hypothetical protein [Oscillatoriales cyanobacterium SM2_2_1]